MQPHSIKVPRLYKIASEIYRKVKDEGASLKDILYQANHPNKKAIYAMVLTTIQRDTQIDFLLKKSEFLTKENGIKPPLARVLIAELLWGKKRLSSECRPVKSVLAFQQIFQAHCTDLNDNDEPFKSKKVPKPRYVRVNTMKLPVNEAVDAFRDEGWTLKRFVGDNYQEFIAEVDNLGEYEFMVDLHVPDLLIFPPRTEFYRHVAYKCGEVVLQDKASCLPVTILNPPPGSQVLDMCAAPGMKTTQLAGLINNEGKVYAVEKDGKRMETLKTMVESSGATCVETIFKDVLTVDASTLPDVEYILVDPSCSGTGITDRVDLDELPTPQGRINKLSGFQIMVLKHAMRSFPKVKRIVYSTCSLLPEENEAVVQDVISSNGNFKLLNGKELLKSWHNYGSDDYEVGKYCIYARPEYDLTNGFFVAVFERLQDGEVNEFLKRDTNYKQRNGDNSNVNNHRKKKEDALEDDNYNNENRENTVMDVENGAMEDDASHKKKKKKQKNEDTCQEQNDGNENEENHNIKKSKKKKVRELELENQKETNEETDSIEKKKKKQKDEDICLEQNGDNENEENHNTKKSKKNKEREQELENQKETNEETDSIEKKKKKKSKKASLEEDLEGQGLNTTETDSSLKKSKKKSKSHKDETISIGLENESQVGDEIDDSQMELSIKAKSKKKKRKTQDNQE